MSTCRRNTAALLACAALVASCQSPMSTRPLLHPEAPEVNRQAPPRFLVRLETSQGLIDVEVHRDWSPRGADRFYNLVRSGYYDDSRFFRVIAGKWAQFGINGDPKIAKAWRAETIPDDPRLASNQRGTIAFAFAVPNGRTTEVFINLRDNSSTHDAEPFVPFGKIIAGMDVADRLDSEYGETSGGGIRAGKQAPLFEQGNAYLDERFPRLDRIVRARIFLRPTNQQNRAQSDQSAPSEALFYFALTRCPRYCSRVRFPVREAATFIPKDSI